MGKSTYTPELATEICERLSGGEPLRQICRDPHMPAWRTVYDWISQDESFAARIAHARDLGYDAIAEQCLDIADDGTNDFRPDDSGKVALDKDHIQRSKLRVETRLKLLAKWSPKKYGDKQQVELAGNLAVTNMSEEEIRAELAGLVTAGVIPSEIVPAGGDDDIADLL